MEECDASPCTFMKWLQGLSVKSYTKCRIVVRHQIIQKWTLDCVKFAYHYCIHQPGVALEGVVALVAEGGAVAACAAALFGHVQVILAVECDPVLGPRRLVVSLARD